MAVDYYLYNQFYHDKVMMYDAGTGLVKLSTPVGNANQKWVIERYVDIGCHVGYKIRNVAEDHYLATEYNGQNVTVTRILGNGDDNNTWLLPGRPHNANQFITNIKSADNGNLLANNGHFIVTNTNGQKWRFVITPQPQQM